MQPYIQNHQILVDNLLDALRYENHIHTTDTEVIEGEKTVNQWTVIEHRTIHITFRYTTIYSLAWNKVI